MEISYWSDVACPFCYIGAAHMKEAMARVGILDETELVMKAFELEPNAPKKAKAGSLAKRIAVSHELSKEETKKYMARVERLGASEGLEMHMDKVVAVNTFDAHRLIKFAQSRGDRAVTEALIARLYAAYFARGESVAETSVLTAIAGECGLPAGEAAEVLASDRFAREVRADEQEAAAGGVNSVPFFVFNDKYAVSGAMPVENLVEALTQVLSEERPAASAAPEGACGPEGCRLTDRNTQQ